MSVEKIEIKLTHDGDQLVDMEKMSLQAINSFLTVTTCLKNISETVSDNFTFTIKKSSAYTSVNGNASQINLMYKKMDDAILGNSNDDIVTANLREIQKQLKNSAFDYRFYYGKEMLDDRIRNAKQIKKKSNKAEFDYRLKVISGLFNQIGGHDPNYHFDYGHGNKLTIECTKDQAAFLKHHLYKNIHSLVLEKDFVSKDVKSNFYHLTTVEEDYFPVISKFIKVYYDKDDLLDRLDFLYDFVDDSDSKLKVISILLKAFKNRFFHLSEIKTVLLVSQDFQHHEDIKLDRDELLKFYMNLRNTSANV